MRKIAGQEETETTSVRAKRCACHAKPLRAPSAAPAARNDVCARRAPCLPGKAAKQNNVHQMHAASAARNDVSQRQALRQRHETTSVSAKRYTHAKQNDVNCAKRRLCAPSDPPAAQASNLSCHQKRRLLRETTREPMAAKRAPPPPDCNKK